MDEQAQLIRGKVARIISSREIVINKGLHDGVRVGMVFKILSTKGAEITDPDTGEVLGAVELEKASVRVTEVQERIAIASTYRSQRVNVGGIPIPAMPLLGAPKWETRFETLKTNEALAVDLDEEDSYVNTGDPVVQVHIPEAGKDEQNGQSAKRHAV